MFVYQLNVHVLFVRGENLNQGKVNEKMQTMHSQCHNKTDRVMQHQTDRLLPASSFGQSACKRSWYQITIIYRQKCAPSPTIPPLRIFLTSPSTTTGCQNASHLRSMESWGIRLHPPVSPLMIASRPVSQAHRQLLYNVQVWKWDEAAEKYSIDSSVLLSIITATWILFTCVRTLITRSCEWCLALYRRRTQKLELCEKNRSTCLRNLVALRCSPASI